MSAASAPIHIPKLEMTIDSLGKAKAKPNLKAEAAFSSARSVVI